MLNDTSKFTLYSLLDNYLPVPFSENAFIVLWYFSLYAQFFNLGILFSLNISLLQGIQKQNVLECLISHMLLYNVIVLISLSKPFSLVMNISPS